MFCRHDLTDCCYQRLVTDAMIDITFTVDVFRRFLFLVTAISIAYAMISMLHSTEDIHSSASYSYGVVEETHHKSNNYTPRLSQPLTQSVTRALLVFYPDQQENQFLPELRWFYRSWIEMMKYEPRLWRTDLVIFTGNYTAYLQMLGCVYNTLRMDRDEPPRCRVFPYQKLNDRPFKVKSETNYSQYQQIDPHRERKLMQYLRTYEYIDSINIISECYSTFAMYDFILRTDLDVFLTKTFGIFVPENQTFLVGRGGYSTPFNAARLKRIARNMNWSYANINNIGSTWYGSGKTAQMIANYTLDAMAYLSWNEFTTPERERKLGVMLWPEWHYGVLLLYGSHLAINHLVSQRYFHLGLAQDLLDQGVVSKDPTDIEKNRRLHLHCWHGSEPFSKFSFKDGLYNNISAAALLNDTSASGYAMRMALESKRMSPAQLRNMLSEVKLNR